MKKLLLFSILLLQSFDSFAGACATLCMNAAKCAYKHATSKPNRKITRSTSAKSFNQPIPKYKYRLRQIAAHFNRRY